MIKKIVLMLLTAYFVFILPVLADKYKQKTQSLANAKKTNPDTITMLTIVFSQIIKTQIPETWSYERPAFEKINQKNHYIVEFLPKAQNLNNWKEMFTMQGFKNTALQENVKPEFLIYAVANSIKNLSKKDFIFSIISKEKINGYSAVIALIGCANIRQNHFSSLKKGQADVSLYLSIKGKKDMYLIHKSWKTTSFGKNKLPIEKAEINKWIGILKRVELLDKK